MSVAYRMNTAYDYRREDDETERRERNAARKRQQRRNAAALVMRRTVALLGAVMVAAVCVGLLYVKSQVYHAQLDVNKLLVNIDEAERQNSSLNEQYNEAVNINVIMDRAEDLGMDYPDPKNVLYVNVGTDTSMKNDR